MVTCMGLLGVIFSTLYVRVIDRRVIMLVGVAACGLSQLAQAIAWSVSPNSEESGKVVVAFIALFTFFYVAYGKLQSFLQLKARLTFKSSIRLACRWRVSKQRTAWLRLRPGDCTEFPRQLARHIHRAIFHQPSRS
jgi:hypothetical protein